MAVVVEEAVVRMQRLRVDAVRQARRNALPAHVLPIVADVHRVVLAEAAVFPDLIAVHRNVAEEDCDAFTRLPDDFAVRGEVLDQRVDLPEIADQIAAEAHLREDDNLSPGRASLVDVAQHFGCVEVRTPRQHLHLDEGDRWQVVEAHVRIMED